MLNAITNTTKSLKNLKSSPEKIPQLKKPSHIGAKPTSIDIKSGAGVPGGFTANNIKNPLNEVKNISLKIASSVAMLSKVTSVMTAIKSGQIPHVPGIAEAMTKLNKFKQQMLKKLSVAKLAPNFSAKFKLPPVPTLPSVPDFKSMGIPDLPSIPNVGLPSLPSIPNVGLPSIPNIPTLPNIPNIPTMV